MTFSDAPMEFEAWALAVTANPEVPDDDPDEIDRAAMQWLRETYDTHGPISREAVESAAAAHLTALGNDAVDAVVADLHRTTSYRPSVHFEMMGDAPTVVINDGYTSPSMFEWGRPEAIAEVAGYFQEQMADEIRGWPTCEAHAVQMYAKARDDQAVWWCRAGNHDLAPIGSLDSRLVKRNDPEPVAIDVELTLREGTDPRAPGGEVTRALCGHWEHEGPCRWPHNSRIDTDLSPAQLRIVLIARAAEIEDVISRIDMQLRPDERWAVERFETGEISPDEQALADRLAHTESP